MDRLSRLELLRDQLTAWLDESPADRANLSLRLITVLEQIDSLKPPTEKAGDPIDEIARRRAARGAGPAKGGRKAGVNTG